MQRSKGQGWAAFSRKQQGKQGTGTECIVDPYPSISEAASSGSAKSLINNNCGPTRSFSSVVRPSVGFTLVVGRESLVTNDDNTGAKHHIDQKHHINQNTREYDATLVQMLKDIYIWADQTLIEDVLEAVNNDVDQASVLLKAMVSSETKSDSPRLSSPCSSTVSCACDSKTKCSGESNSVGNKLSEGGHEVVVSKSLFRVPAEPEWEEDDIYLSHRKEAVRMMRVASQHSRAATNAFLRGDHVSAQQHSLRARDEWMAAEKLNGSAAKEILCIRNSKNDIRKLDLHGLHASEAVSALKDRLQKIESVMMQRSASSDALPKLECGISRSVSSDCVSEIDINSDTKKKDLPQQRQTILHVITGTGNHSRGQASLPSAVKSFLIENGYRFDDASPGVFAIRPKFRPK